MTAAVAAAALALHSGARAQSVLDARAEAADVVLTWDTGPDDLLRGTAPDDLRPFLASVASPLRLVGENVLRGEHAFYRLASGSNMAFRVERTFPVADPSWPILLPSTLPERRAWTLPSELFAAWPTLTEAAWYDGAQQRWESLSRIGGLLLGDDEPVPRHGGVWLAFSETTTVTLVGSHDDAYAGPGIADLLPVANPLRWAAVPVPYHADLATAFEVLCGREGVDWVDSDADGRPDECGTDGDADGAPDTGLWHGLRMCRGCEQQLTIQAWRGPFDHPTATVVVDDIFGESVAGSPFVLAPGEGVVAYPLGGPTPVANTWRPPTW